MQQQQGPLPPLTGYSAVQPVTQAPLGSLPYNPDNAAAGTVAYSAAAAAGTVAYSAAGGGGVTPNYAFNGAPAAGQVLPNYGMDYLALLDQIIVKQQIEPLESEYIINKYTLNNIDLGNIIIIHNQII